MSRYDEDQLIQEAQGILGDEKAYAESKGVTIQMIVAITEDHIHVLNRDTEDRLTDHVARFDRSTCKVEVTKFGLSRQLTLTDPGSGASLELTGGVSPLAVTAKGDKTVLKLLAA